MKNFITFCCNIIFLSSVFSQGNDILIYSATNIDVSENSVFISPLDKNIVINANNIIQPSLLSTVGIFTNNNGGGGTWTFANSFVIADPAAVIDRNGNKYVLNVTVGINSTKLGISIFDNATSTWSNNTIQESPDNIGCTDKDHLWVDNRLYKQDATSNPFSGNLYAVSGYDKVIFFSSSNQGQSWSPQCSTSCNSCQMLSSLSSTSLNTGVNIQTGPNGEIYTCWINYAPEPGGGYENKILFNRSLDGGVTWSDAAHSFDPWIAINNIRGISSSQLPGKTMGVRSFPSMTVNQQNGHIYIVWTNYTDICNPSFPPPDCNADVYMIRSIDRGDTWSSPIKVNPNDPNADDQWMPWIACDETSNALVCCYYGSQDCISQNNDCANTYVAISYDDGNTWTETRISDLEWNADVGAYPGHEYIGLDVYHGHIVPVWADDQINSGSLSAYSDPFEVPCPQDLNLIYGDYYITNEKTGTTFSNDAFYSASNSIYVKGSGLNSTYRVYPGANVVMTAGNDVVLDAGFYSEGDFYAYTGSCTNFSQRLNNNNNNSETTSPSSLFSSNLTANQTKNFPLEIFPNPSSDGKIKSYIPSVATDKENKIEQSMAIISIYNSTGEVVYHSNTNQSISEINLSSQPAGLYMITVMKGDKVYNGKIILQ